MNIGDWTERFTGTRQLPPELRQQLREVATVLHYPQGAQVFRPDKVPDKLFFLYDGTLRVSQSSENGREIVLYRVEAGESCVLTTACMLADETYNTEGIAETDVTAITLPRHTFNHLAATEPVFRDFVFTAYSRRLIDLMRVVDEVAFGRIDVRLAQKITNLAGSLREVSTTHGELAKELGTAREVVTRVLQDFQKRGLIMLSRGRIEITDAAQLSALAHSD